MFIWKGVGKDFVHFAISHRTKSDKYLATKFLFMMALNMDFVADDDVRTSKGNIKKLEVSSVRELCVVC